ncbi:MAG: tRNA (adenosine(37)-N6)-threonylcarbamoyltransferase complex ATPase subunit type 1 TsaE [Saprospiraceae bacterium]|jgi:tRNA threonylcarbamoyladenosine biosynthesis protein TsaE|nr:tRNA (adenosine(37)-N6)-threonylcarbamoyltransferase complex ATPase subunit type 1 TsaE [Saprospiraceae bacterium]MBL0023492.1 tRNA (adenosine(37)-N6)-threonylcarbamoyltransferase complex ATPase subunit type 1 TsaE [Saprospiraceae bacterium]
MWSFIVESPSELVDIARSLLSECQESKIFALTGNLGAGKTTLIRYLCRQLGYTGEVTSPTFSLINEYQTKSGPVYHMDLYRVKNIEEAQDFGIEEYLYSGNYCFIEWPEILEDILDSNIYSITITPSLSGERKIEVRLLSKST